MSDDLNRPSAEPTQDPSSYSPIPPQPQTPAAPPSPEPGAMPYMTPGVPPTYPPVGQIPPTGGSPYIPPTTGGMPSYYGAPPATSQPSPPQPPYASYPTQPPYNYYQQQQPGYIPPYYPSPVEPNRAGDGMAVASLVLGILSVIVCCFTFLCIPLSVVGLVLGIVAKKRGSSGMATAGIVLNAVGLALSVILIILYIVDISWSYQLEDPYVMSHLLF